MLPVPTGICPYGASPQVLSLTLGYIVQEGIQHLGHSDPICTLALSHSDWLPTGHSDLSVGEQPNHKGYLLHTRIWKKIH